MIYTNVAKSQTKNHLPSKTMVNCQILKYFKIYKCMPMMKFSRLAGKLKK